MPTTQTLTVATSQLRADDLIHGFGAYQSQEPKAKWTTLHLQNGSSERVLIGAELTVDRIVPTEEERAEANRQMKIEWLTRRLESAREELAQVQSKIIDSLTAGYEIGWSEMNQIAKAQQVWRLWAGVERIMEVRECDIAEAHEAQSEQVRERLLSGYTVQRSTDPFSRAIGETDTEVHASFLRFI